MSTDILADLREWDRVIRHPQHSGSGEQLSQHQDGLERLLRRSPFSPWVLPLRLAGAAIFVFHFAWMLIALDIAMLLAALVASLIWQLTTVVEERSRVFQRLRPTR